MQRRAYGRWIGGLVLCCSVSVAQALSIDIVPITQGVGVGNTATVEVVISGLGDFVAPSLASFDVDVHFDATRLALGTTDANLDGVIDSVALDPTAQLDLAGLGGNLVAASLLGPGSVNLFTLSFDSAQQLDDEQRDTFSLARLSFHTLSVGVSPLDITINDLGDAVGNAFFPDIRPASITVTAVPEPSALILFGISCAGLFLGQGWRRWYTAHF